MTDSVFSMTKKTHHQPTPQISRKLWKEAKLLVHSSQYKEALEIITQANTNDILCGNNNNKTTTQHCRNLHLQAQCLSELAQYDEALGIANEALTIAEMLPVDNAIQDEAERDSCISAAITCIIHALNGKGQFSDSLEMCKRSIETCMKWQAFPYDDTLVVAILNRAWCFYNLGRYEESLVDYEKVIEMLELSPNNNVDSRKSTTMNGKGVCLIGLARYNEALVLYGQLLDSWILQKNDYSHNIHVSYLFNNRANAFFSLGRYQEALLDYQEALTISLNACPSNHPNVTRAYNNRAECFIKLGQFDQALQDLDMALSCSTTLEQNPAKARSLQAKSRCLELMHENGTALELINQAISLDMNTFGTQDHPDVASNFSVKGLCLIRLKRFDEAVEVMEQALAMSRRVHNDQHPRYLKCLGRSGFALKCFFSIEKNGGVEKQQEGEDRVEHAIEGLSKVLGRHHPETVLCVEEWGGDE
jgi:tetratricopeptide (TPR) repeat protein